MDTNDIPQEEKDLEAAASQEAKEEEIRAKVIEEYGFDEVDDVERVNKLVGERMESHKKLTQAVGQKIKYRSQAQELSTKIPKTPPPTDAKPKVEDVDKMLDEKLAQRELEALEYPDNIRKEIAEWSKYKGISIKQAARSPHIASQISDWEKEQNADEAAIKRKNRSGGTSDFSSTPPDVDMATEEGRKKYEDWKREAVKRGM